MSFLIDLILNLGVHSMSRVFFSRWVLKEKVSF